jgi:membrane-bound serine protease (ClpP class)
LGRVGSFEIIFFLAGVACLAIEIFVLPGFGVVGVSGIILIGLSLVMSMQDFVIPQFSWEWSLLGRNVLVVFAALFLGILSIAVLMLFSPKIRIFDLLTLKTQITGTAGGPDPDSTAGKAVLQQTLPEDEDFTDLLGKTGTADSVLRPSGKALINGKIYTAESDGEFVEPGKDIVVTRVRGNRIIVRRV